MILIMARARAGRMRWGEREGGRGAPKHNALGAASRVAADDAAETGDMATERANTF